MSVTPPPTRRVVINNRSPRRELSPAPAHNTNGRRTPSPNPPTHSRPRRQVNADTTRPLLQTNSANPTPPLAGPEIDDVDDRETVRNPYPGVDDGFFPPETNGNGSTHPDVENVPDKPVDGSVYPESEQPDLGRYPAHYPHQPDFPYAPGYGPEVYNIPEYTPTEFGSESIPDVNVYQHKKTLAQGMMDLALFSANANQLRYVLESYDRHPYYYPSVILIGISLLFQVAVGVGLIWNAHYNVKDKKEICIANKINNFTIIGIFLVTVVNVFISAFGVANAPTPSAT